MAVIGFVAAIVAAPLAYYFLIHPDSFAESVGGILCYDRQRAGASGAGARQKCSENSRHVRCGRDQQGRRNPAGRSPFDPLLGIWLVAGVVLALVRWRSLPHLFGVLWLAVLSLPAVLSTPAPHSLRALAMLPAAYMLAVVAMLRLAVSGPVLATLGDLATSPFLDFERRNELTELLLELARQSSARIRGITSASQSRPVHCFSKASQTTFG